MKMRASELSSAAILSDGSLSIGFRSSTDTHTIEFARKAQEQLLPALLASEPADKVNGRVTYSQQILQEFGWIEKGVGRGIDTIGTGYSQI